MRFIKWFVCLGIIGFWSASVSAQPGNCYNYQSPKASNADNACDFTAKADSPLISGRWQVQSVDRLDNKDCPLLNGEVEFQFALQDEGETLIARQGAAAVGGRKFKRSETGADTYVYTRTTRLNTIHYSLHILSPDHFTITWTNPFKTCDVVEDYQRLEAGE